ncbi:MAG: 16S rRNA (uracil(1498)-N(3))-methyltransferase [Moorea sp. SIO2B7]|nr:16S rRNA (uracil(1498)-N(3))-methyltransferase [Moorena sp. SIO2B7]
MTQLQRLVINPTQKQDDQIILKPQQQHYLRRVLRLGDSDRFVAMDGHGKSWLAQLSQDKAEILNPLSQTPTELALNVTLMVALPKGNGFDEVVRCCTELGVTTFIPVISDRTLIKPSPNKLQRWRRISQEAAEQSERQIVPTIVEPIKFTTALTQSNDLRTDCYICVARGDAPHLLDSLQNKEQHKIVIATGPEGGWTASEVQGATSAKFHPVSLGNRILRAITAPIVALSLVASIAETAN